MELLGRGISGHKPREADWSTLFQLLHSVSSRMWNRNRTEQASAQFSLLQVWNIEKYAWATLGCIWLVFPEHAPIERDNNVLFKFISEARKPISFQDCPFHRIEPLHSSAFSCCCKRLLLLLFCSFNHRNNRKTKQTIKWNKQNKQNPPKPKPYYLSLWFFSFFFSFQWHWLHC